MSSDSLDKHKSIVMHRMSGCRARRMFALCNGQCPCRELSAACTDGRHSHRCRTGRAGERVDVWPSHAMSIAVEARSEEHTSELQSQFHLVCRLLLEKKKKI